MTARQRKKKSSPLTNIVCCGIVGCGVVAGVDARGGGGDVLAAFGATAAGPVAGIPSEYMSYYRASADTCPHMDWALLAGIGSVETSHGQSQAAGVQSGSNYAGAAGPMQFLPSTFASVRARHPEIGADLYDPANAIPAAAHKLCDDGVAAGHTWAAIYSYNHSSSYVAAVQSRAAKYRAAA